MYKVIDSFLDDWPTFEHWARNEAKFEDRVNEADGVTYANICEEIPTTFSEEIIQKIGNQLGKEVTEYVMFMRLSPEGVHVPHQAHNDALMGRHTFMLYFDEHEGSGTALLKHKERKFEGQPWTPAEKRAWDYDHNDYDAWEITELVEAKPNRGFLYPAKHMHRAEPVGGYGETQQDARLVLTVFLK